MALHSPDHPHRQAAFGRPHLRPTRKPGRRTAWSVATVVGLTLAAVPSSFAQQVETTGTSAAVQQASSRVPAAFTLPTPTGRQRIGTVALHLVDSSREDPWVAPGRKREVMINLWYPTRHLGGPRAAWLTPAEAGPVGRDLVETVGGKPRDLPGLAQVRTHAQVGAPVAARRGGLPVVLFSPGFGAQRNSDAAVVEDLVSRGYLVVTMDHTHDSLAVQFPDGRVEPNTINALLQQNPEQAETIITKEVGVRVADTRFVLDQLAALNAGRNPDAETARLPSGLAGAFRLSGVGMFGHSLGGATTAQAMHDDRRISAGINLDGIPFGADAAAGLNRPFLLVASADTTRDNTPHWGEFVDHLSGWHREIKVAGSAHLSFHDSVLMAPALARLPGVTAEVIAEAYGTNTGRRAVAVQRAYVGAFFDLHLRRHDRHLLDGPSAAFPEITFVP